MALLYSGIPDNSIRGYPLRAPRLSLGEAAMANWAAEEFAGARNDWAETHAVYRFLESSNEKKRR